MLFVVAICGGVAAREQNVLRALLAEHGHPEMVPRKAQWRQRHCDQNPQVTIVSLSYPSGRPPRGGLNQSQRTHSSPQFSVPEQNTNNKKQKHVRRERSSLSHSRRVAYLLSGILEDCLRKFEEITHNVNQKSCIAELYIKRQNSHLYKA
jgi:hypothetical protein